MDEMPWTPIPAVDAMFNPSLGAYLLWRVAKEYQAERGEALPFALAFIVLPLVLHRTTLEHVVSTQKPSGLAFMVQKLGEQKDNLLAVHDRALQWRELAFNAVAFGVGGGALAVRYAEAQLVALPRSSGPSLGIHVKRLDRGAERLGAWFARLSTPVIFALLKVRL